MQMHYFIVTYFNKAILKERILGQFQYKSFKPTHLNSLSVDPCERAQKRAQLRTNKIKNIDLTSIVAVTCVKV